MEEEGVFGGDGVVQEEDDLDAEWDEAGVGDARQRDGVVPDGVAREVLGRHQPPDLSAGK